MEATQPTAPMSPDPHHLLTQLRYARRALCAAAEALDEARPALQAHGGFVLSAPADLSAWECHILYYRLSALYTMAEHKLTGKPLPSYEPVSGWLK